MLSSLYNAVSGWATYASDGEASQAQQAGAHSSNSSLHPSARQQQPAAGDQHSIEDDIAEVLASLGVWNLRAAMLNCLPVTMHKSHEADDDLTTHLLSPPAAATTGAAAGTAQIIAAAGTAAEGADAYKTLPDTPGKQQQQQQVHIGHSKPGSTTAVLQDAHMQQQQQQQLAGSQPPTVQSLGTQPTPEALQLRQEVSLLAARLSEMTQAVNRLQQENERLRVGGEEEDGLLADAVQQLLREKSSLQQEVSRLNRHNAALQELLDFTAAAGAADRSGLEDDACSSISSGGSGGGGSSGRSPAGSSGSNILATRPPETAEADAAAGAGALTAAAGEAGEVEGGRELQYWSFATPAASDVGEDSGEGAVAEAQASASGANKAAAVAGALAAGTATAAAVGVPAAATAGPAAEAGAAGVKAVSTAANAAGVRQIVSPAAALSPVSVEGCMSREASAGQL